MSKARDLADSAQEINILDGKSFLDEDNLASDSATGIASQQSIKAYVDGITTTNITSTGALNSGSITSGFGNIDNGSSTITTTGAISGGSFVIGSADINENDLESIDGITAGTVSASKAVVVNTNKDITGFRNITATGTISGSLSGTLSGAIASTTTATTQAESDDSTKVATTAYVTDKITTLIGGAPSTLNDLNELAAAINDDANYNTTLTTALATKLPLAGGTLTGNVTFGDNNKAIFGAGTDLQIYHDGTSGNTFIDEGGSGSLFIRDNDNIALKRQTDNANMVVARAGAEVELYHNGSEKLATTSTGVDVTGNVNVSGTVDGRDVATDGTKLDGIEANAKNDQTITAGSGLSGGGTGDVTLSHADTSSVGNSDNSGNTFIQDINFDTYGHVTSVGTGTVSVGNGTLTVQGTGALGGSGTFTANQSGNATISISHSDTSSQGSVNNSGSNFIQDITVDTYGHITGITSAAVGGGTIGYNSTTHYRSSTFTKPNNAVNLMTGHFGNNLNTTVNSSPSTIYEACVTSTFTSDGLATVKFTLPSPNTYNKRGSYWGDIMLFGKKNTNTGKSVAFFQVNAGWTTQTTGFPKTSETAIIPVDSGDRFCIWISDNYTGQASANSHLVYNANTANIIVKLVEIT